MFLFRAYTLVLSIYQPYWSACITETVKYTLIIGQYAENRTDNPISKIVKTNTEYRKIPNNDN